MTEKKEGTGKHGHKDSQGSREHRGEHEKRGEQGQQASSHEQGSSREQEKGGGSEKESLKSREYRDEQGEVHHHTKEYMERHGEKDRDR